MADSRQAIEHSKPWADKMPMGKLIDNMPDNKLPGLFNIIESSNNYTIMLQKIKSFCALLVGKTETKVNEGKQPLSRESAYIIKVGRISSK